MIFFLKLIFAKDCTKETTWEANVKDDNCEMAAHIDESANTISITWNINASSKYDGMSKNELFNKNFKGWATTNKKILQKISQQKFLEQ